MGSGLDMSKGDIGFKCNFSHMDENNIVIKRRVDRMFHHWGLDIIKTVDGISLPDFPDYKVSAMHVKYKFLMMILTI